MSRISPSQARDLLVAGGITGTHRSHPRSGNIQKIHAMLADDDEALFGLSGVRSYTAGEILGFVAELTGCPPDIADLECDDAIAPARTVAAIVSAAERLTKEVQRQSNLLVLTGHPTGLLEHHMRVVDAYRRAGGSVVRPHENERLPLTRKGRHLRIRYNGSVGCLSDGANLLHTHSAEPMEALLAAVEAPDVVLADHGFAGAAVERGIPTLAVMDINDPALAVAWAEGKDITIIPMDDNRPPGLYEPSWRLFEQILSPETL
ncbi:MAG: phosphatase [Actinomycetota bacterium]